MNVTLQNLDTGVVYDVTGDLDEESDVILTAEREESMFVRTADDLDLRVCDFDETFRNLFSQAHPDSEWLVKVEEGRPLFQGYLKNETAMLGLHDEWFRSTVLSVDKKLFERMRGIILASDLTVENTRQLAEEVDANGFFTFESLFRNLLLIPPLKEIAPVADLGEFAVHGMNGSGSYPSTEYLDPSMTIEELVRGIAQWHNAEFFIDVGTAKLLMRRRNSISQDVQTDIDDVLRDDSPIDIFFFDDEKYDYLLIPTAGYMRFDESTGGWDPMISYDANNAPVGRIYQFESALRLRTQNLTSLAPHSLSLIWKLFGSEAESAFLDRWKDLFRTRRRIRCQAHGINFRVGDSVVSKGRLFPNDFTLDERLVVHKATIHLMEDYTELELLTV